ncbi:hypothetical protein T265_04641 [Opisthorchis viverrini]|uniref:Uncharacterized protein n=1 Tax=Opisthorchis viverrini TaxID=6198 RepID=A0A074ZMI5_OPIVI|nr:hypothetical protein T265_04641 [Opisthorchis viverrini]KER28598.1 hypothetical protein T265_04641 [Opisthorchis viverrini]
MTKGFRLNRSSIQKKHIRSDGHKTVSILACSFETFCDLLQTCLSKPTGQMQSYLNTNWTVFEKYTHLQINLVSKRDQTESLVYDVLQLNVPHTGRLTTELARYSG